MPATEVEETYKETATDNITHAGTLRILPIGNLL
jgi:hypothetical protein